MDDVEREIANETAKDTFDKQVTRQFNLPEVEGHNLSTISPIKQPSRTSPPVEETPVLVEPEQPKHSHDQSQRGSQAEDPQVE